MSGRPGPNVIRICKRCGEEYRPVSTRQQCCNKPIKVPCVVCGKLMDQICTLARQNSTCSKECSTELGNRGRLEAAHKLTRKCKYCGKEFVPESSRDFYCKDKHYATCEVCGKPFEITGRMDVANKTCSKECRYISAKRNTDMVAMQQHLTATLKEKYGVENPGQIEGVQEKARAKMREKYGVDYYTQTAEYKERVKQTCREKYGVDHHLAADEVKAKREETIKKKYGVTNVFQSEVIKDKSKQTCLDKYGVEYASQCQDVIDKVKRNNVDKYGVEHPMMLPEYQEKARKTNQERYGYEAFTQSHIKNIENWYKFINNPRDYIAENYATTPRVDDLVKEFGVDRSTIDEHLDRNDAMDCIRRAKSLMEEEVVAYIKSLKPECKIITNNHTILGGKELDIYLPEYNFAIECNPTVTHNSTADTPWGSSKKSINYHKSKTDKCEDKDIFLMHIFGYEWTHNKDVLKSMIANIIGNNQKIYARKCQVVNVTSEEAKAFLQKNHRQGFAATKIHLGLKYNDEIVSIMSFGKMRGTIGIDTSDLSECWELVRFCNKLNTTVIGGASKLFKYFVTTYKPTLIRSFSDRAHTKGNLYKILGFTEIRRSDANYTWVNVVDDKGYHRINTQKRNLKRFLKDNDIDLSQSEREIMEAHGFVRVYDSGTITWEWRQ